MAISFEHVLHLFNSVWFHNQIFPKQKLSNEKDEEEEPKKSQLENAKALAVRSHFLISSGASSFSSDSQSPTSVLPSPKLQTIFSDKEVSSFYARTMVSKRKIVNRQRKLEWRNRAGSSKSLSDLEFEELKGFEDLGFVFSKEDHEDAELVSIVPGLHRLQRRSNSINLDVERPYLSEAWGVMEKKEEALLKPATVIINHKIRQSVMESEMVIKEQIKCWAHSVANAIS